LPNVKQLSVVLSIATPFVPAQLPTVGCMHCPLPGSTEFVRPAELWGSAGMCSHAPSPSRCPANMAHIRQPEIYSGFQGKVLHLSSSSFFDRKRFKNACQVRYRRTSPIKNSALLGPYKKTMPRVFWKPSGRGLFLTNEVPLYVAAHPGRPTSKHPLLLSKPNTKSQTLNNQPSTPIPEP